MNLTSNLRVTRILSQATTAFAVLMLLIGLVQIGLGGVAVSQEYDRIAQVEQRAREQARHYGYRMRESQLQKEYNRSSTAFFVQGRFLPSQDNEEPNPLAMLSAIGLVVAALAFLLSAMVWVWRAQANLRELGIRTKYGPAMSVAAFFIPLANLFLPFEIMRELYNRSEGEGDDFAHSTVDDVTAWYAALISGLLIVSFMLVKFTLDLGTNFIIITPLWMEFGVIAFAFILLLGSAWLFAGLARSITSSQEEFLPQVDPAVVQQSQPERPRVTLIE